MVAVMEPPTPPPRPTNISLSTEPGHVTMVCKWITKLYNSKRAADPSYQLDIVMQLDYLADHRTPAALTLQAEQYCMIFDLIRLPLSTITKIFRKIRDTSSMRLIAQTASQAAAACASFDVPTNIIHEESTPMIYDLQLGHELLDGTFGATFSDTAELLGAGYLHNTTIVPICDGKQAVLNPFVERARTQRHVFEMLGARLSAPEVSLWLQLSTSRARKLFAQPDITPWTAELSIGFRSAVFEVQSAEIVQDEPDAADTTVSLEGEREELQKLCELLPVAWSDKLMDEVHRQLIDIEVDVGRPPFAFFREGPKLILSDDRDDVATEEHLEYITRCLEDFGDGIGGDNRAGINGTLHRVSVIRSPRARTVVGATLRASRHIFGVSTLLYDILLSHVHAKDSILLVGPPGSGKTTMSRDIARLLSETQRVVIVDSSDEIGGPGAVAHRCIGDARRMSVPGGKHKLAETLIEAVENHTPDIVIADELSDRYEVAGASTAKNRGVRLVSSAHGTLRSLIKNEALRGLIGGLERVIMGDFRVKRKESRNRQHEAKEKLKTIRAGEPVFGVVVEMGVVEGDPSACRIIRNCGQAVDDILEGKKYKCQLRRRDNSGNIVMCDTCA